MANNKMDAYIKKERDKGFSNRQIRKKLIAGGYTPKRIDQALGGSSAKSYGKYGIILLIVLIVSASVYFFLLPEPLPGIRECELNESSAESCIFLLAFAKQDIAYCDELGTSAGKEKCKSNMLKLSQPQPEVKLAVESGEYSSCLSIEDTFLRGECQSYFKEGKLEVTGCEEPFGESPFLECKWIHYIETNDFNSCGLYKEYPPSGDHCYTLIAKRLNSINVCNQIDDSMWKTTCIGLIQGTAKVCDAFEDISSQSFCKAIILNDAEICRQYKNVPWCISKLKTINIYTNRVKYLGS